MYRLMIVDDSNIIRNRIQRIYNANEFMLVATASNGEEAVEKFKANRAEVVTMDLTMPQMDGLECIEKLVALDPQIRILVVSALSDKATGIKALDTVDVGVDTDTVLQQPTDTQPTSAPVSSPFDNYRDW